ncbi:hypothetical protein VTO42DRAFT_1501 [Malbranchea cinnamomea]
MVGLKSLLLSGLLAVSALGAPVERQVEPRFLGSGKRGLAFNDLNALQIFLSKPVFSWSYNWAATGPTNGPEFVPMLWGPKTSGEWTQSIEASLSAGAKCILGFNEPDLPSQANMSPQEAVDAWKTYMNPYAGRARLGSPAVTNGGGNMGLNWLRTFLDMCAGECTVDFLAIHWYSPASEIEGFKRHVSQAIELARSHGINEVWVTEFRGEGDPMAQIRFLAEVLPWLDGTDGVGRYAYFMVDDLVTGGGLSPVGMAYSDN